MLEEGVSDHRHERMTVKALPGSPLEVIETEFFSQLLVSPLANPSRLDGCLVISPSVAAFPSLYQVPLIRTHVPIGVIRWT